MPFFEPPAPTFPTAGVPSTVPRAAPTAPPEEGPQQEEHPEEEQREEDESEREEASRLLHPHHLGSVSGLGQAVGNARVIGRHSDGDPCQDHQNDHRDCRCPSHRLFLLSTVCVAMA